MQPILLGDVSLSKPVILYSKNGFQTFLLVSAHSLPATISTFSAFFHITVNDFPVFLSKANYPVHSSPSILIIQEYHTNKFSTFLNNKNFPLYSIIFISNETSC